MQDMAVAWITQKRSALDTFLEFLRLKGNLAPAGHQTADVQAPMGVQVVHHPVVTLHAREVLIRSFEMSHKIGGLARGPDGPSYLSGGDGQGVDEYACTAANVLVFAAFALPWSGGFGGRFAIEYLHTALLVAADHQTTLFEGLKCSDIQLANGLSLGLKVLVVAIQPVFALMRLEIDVVQDTPDA